jgi:RNA polymerase sigma factor (sigma-70 family)
VIDEKRAVADELLFLRCRRGERSAWDALIRQWEPPLLYYVRRLVAGEEDAWDVLQQVWVRALRGIASLHDPRRVPAWLYSIARCTAMSHWRGYYRSQARLEKFADGAAPSESNDVDRFDDAEQVHRALGELPAAQRDVLRCSFWRICPWRKWPRSWRFRWAPPSRVCTTPSKRCARS